MSNGQWLHDAVERIESRLEGIERRLATHEGEHRGMASQMDRGLKRWQIVLGAVGLVASIGFSVAALFRV